MENPKLIISPKLLLHVYSILPSMLLLVGLDLFFLDGRIRSLLPRSQSQLFVALVLLDLPHILASSLSFFDRDYLHQYKQALFIRIPIVCLVLIAVSLTYPLLLALIYGAWTMYHVVNQQTGIAGMLIQSRNGYYLIWRKVAALIGILGFFIAYIFPSTLASSRVIIGIALLGLIIPFACLTKLVAKDSSNKLGTTYLWSTCCMVLTAVLLYAYHPFLSFSTYLAIHGITAFIYYIAHDVNRNKDTYYNYLYRLLTWNYLTLILLAPVLALTLTFLVYLSIDNWYTAQGAQYVIVFTVTSILPAIHYYTEATMWKHGSLHRKQIEFERW